MRTDHLIDRSARRRRARRGARLAVLGAVAAVALWPAADHASASTVVDGRIRNGTLILTGGTGSDVVTLRLAAGDATTLEIDAGADGSADLTFPRAGFSRIVAKPGAGDDQIRVDEVNGVFTDTERTTLNGNAGIDVLVGGSGSERLVGGADGDVVDGNQGVDTVLLGTGDDGFIWNPGDGNDVVEGADGADLLAFNGSAATEQIALAADGTRIRMTRDVGNAVLSANAFETVAVELLAGTDTMVVGDLTATGVTLATVDLAVELGSATGDGQDDRVVVTGSGAADTATVAAGVERVEVTGLATTVHVAHSQVANDRLTVDGVGGADAVAVEGGAGPELFDVVPASTPGRVAVAGGPLATIGFEVTAVESLSVRGNGGADELAGTVGLAPLVALTLDGGPGTDTLLGGDGPDVLVGGTEADLVLGRQGADTAQMGAGADTFVWNPGDGSDVVEGGTETDVLDFNGSGAGEDVAVSPEGTRVRLSRDVSGVEMDVDDVETLALDTMGGADTTVFDSLAGTDMTVATVDLAAVPGGTAGDGHPDTVVVNGSAGDDSVQVGNAGTIHQVTGSMPAVQVARSEGANDRLVVDGGEGTDATMVLGTILADTVNVTPAGDELGRLAVRGGPLAALPLDVGSVEDLVVSGSLGPDTLTTGFGVPPTTTVTLDGGAGADTLTGGQGDDVLVGGPDGDTVVGRQGADTVVLGTGNDTFTWNVGDGNDVVDGDDGSDRLAFNGNSTSEVLGVSANGGRATVTRAAAGVVLDVAGLETVDLNPLGGSDQVVAGDLSGTGVTLVGVDLESVPGAGAGDGQPDVVTVDGTPAGDFISIAADGGVVTTTGLPAAVHVSHSQAATDDLVVNGGNGIDSITTGPGVTGLIGVTTNP